MRAALLAVVLVAAASCQSDWKPDPCDTGNDFCGYSEASTDSDGDGYVDVAFYGDDCDDNDAATYPGAPPSCDGTAIDADCDGVEDLAQCDVDGDGMTPVDGDCDDYDVDSHTGAEEFCGDAIDQDCDGADDASDDDCAETDSGTGA